MTERLYAAFSRYGDPYTLWWAPPLCTFGLLFYVVRIVDGSDALALAWATPWAAAHAFAILWRRRGRPRH